MDPAVVVPLAPLLPGATSALAGPLAVAIVVVFSGLAAIVGGVLRDVPERRHRIVLDVVAHPVVDGGRAARSRARR
jgi:hypothetical protein